ncbi:DUF2079 domain-containing protein [Streptomyces sp. SBC-4]|nr:DUF2079 domain-containing protein [Streptomyces sp. SBC-4]MDV5145037.1 DUF2079 domain-containing protein [Streptomyces sp. SBC-4]
MGTFVSLLGSPADMNISNLSVDTLQRRTGTGSDERTTEGSSEAAAGTFSKAALLTSGAFFLIYLLASARRHATNLSTGYDLGIFTQIVKSYSEFTAPYSDLKGPAYNTLGDHFHPILALLGPVYRIFPSSYTLLVCQAALVAFSIAPLMKWAYKVKGRKFAYWIGISYGASWGIAELISFDFHEVAFAVPLLSLSLCAAGQKNWRSAALWSIPLVLVKEDLGLTVAAIGLYVAWKGPRVTGLAVAAFGAGATALEMLVILPYFNPLGTFAYWPPEAAEEAGLLMQVTGALWPPVKWLTLFLIVAPTGFLALRSPILLVAVPTLAWRFTSENPFYWGTGFHYSAVLMPIAFAAAIHAVATGVPSRRVMPACVIGAVATSVTFFTHPLHELVLPRTSSETAHVKAADALLEKIPDGSTVAASNRLAAQLADRATVSEVCLFPRSFPPKDPAQWVIYDVTDNTDPDCATGSGLEAPSPSLAGYRVVETRDGISLLKRIDDQKSGNTGR